MFLLQRKIIQCFSALEDHKILILKNYFETLLFISSFIVDRVRMGDPEVSDLCTLLDSNTTPFQFNPSLLALFFLCLIFHPQKMFIVSKFKAMLSYLSNI